jgi:hypothetical protein
MTYKITHKNSTVSGTPPTAGDIDVGEIAINAADAEIYTKDANGNIRKFQNTATGTAAGVQFTQSGTGAVQRTVESKLQDVVSVLDFIPQSEHAAIKAGTSITDVTTYVQSALDSGAKSIKIPEGTYVTTGVEIKSTSVVEEVIGQGMPTLKLTAGTSRVALLVNKSLVRVENLILQSTGTNSDGYNTVGLKMPSRAYTIFRNIRAYNFSLRGLQIIQCVYATFENITVQGCTYGISFERDPSNNVQCTAYTLTNAYITGCTRGISQNGSVNPIYTQCLMEYCGDAVASEGAFHAAGGGGVLINCYWEANYRNVYASDAGLEFVGKYQLTATAPDIVSYAAAAFDLRGTTDLGSNKIKTRFLAPDDFSGYDLQFGTNLIAPLAGGSVKFGDTTTETLTGTAVANTWTTVKAIPATEMTGTTQQKAAYFYTIYTGYSDLGTGFDCGTIFNDTLRSFTGTTPSWLRLNSQNIQVNLASSSYGLLYKLVLHRIFPGTV